MKTFKLEIKFSQKKIEDILDSAFVNQYWYNVLWKKIPVEHKEDNPICFSEGPLRGFALTIEDTEDNKDYILDEKAIIKGIKLLGKALNKKIDIHCNDSYLHSLLGEDYDNDDADIFLQLCILGDTIYG